MKPFRTRSISAAASAFSPGSGAVCSSASRSSARSTWPLSSSSKAEKADSSSELGESAASVAARELRKAPIVMVCGADGGKNCDTPQRARWQAWSPPAVESALPSPEIHVHQRDPPSWFSMSATSSRPTVPSLSRSRISKPSRSVRTCDGCSCDSALLLAMADAGLGTDGSARGAAAGASSLAAPRGVLLPAVLDGVAPLVKPRGGAAGLWRSRGRRRGRGLAQRGRRHGRFWPAEWGTALAGGPVAQRRRLVGGRHGLCLGKRQQELTGLLFVYILE